jgi:hypothetical protein
VNVLVLFKKNVLVHGPANYVMCMYVHGFSGRVRKLMQSQRHSDGHARAWI